MMDHPWLKTTGPIIQRQHSAKGAARSLLVGFVLAVNLSNIREAMSRSLCIVLKSPFNTSVFRKRDDNANGHGTSIFESTN
jgi:hypothetical protein